MDFAATRDPNDCLAARDIGEVLLHNLLMAEHLVLVEAAQLILDKALGRL